MAGIENIQNDDLVKDDLRRQQAMESERAPWESLYRDVERYIDPNAAGGFTQMSPGNRRGEYLFDVTAIQSLGRFDAALGYVTTPKNQRWHGLTVLDKDLAKLPAVTRWCEHAVDRLFACRYAPHVGAGVQFSQDRRQLGSYGTGPMLVDDWAGRQLIYNTLHMSEVYIDENYVGRVDTVHRKFTLTARQAGQKFGADALPPKIRECLQPGKDCEAKFEFLHVIRPNEAYAPERLDWKGKPIVSRYVAIAEKWIVRQGGYRTMPIAVSRNVTSPHDKYGRSPAMEVLPQVKGLNAMVKTILRAGHKRVDPALVFHDDGDISKLVTKPGGLNPGLVDPVGRLLVGQVPSGDPAFGLELVEAERAPVRTAFLEEFFKILTDPSDRMTATQVLEMVAKQGVLIQPFADRYETEKLGVMVDRELDILMDAGQIDPFPPEMVEAGARPLVVMTNPLAKMARSGEAAAATRLIEVAVQAASAGRADALDRINFDTMIPDVADVLGARPSWILSDEELADLRRQRAAKEAVQQAATVAPPVAQAALNLAQADQLGNGQMAAAA